MEVDVSDGIAGLALVLSGITLWRQRGLDELTKRLNELQIRKEEGEASAEKRADLFADFVKSSRSSYHLRVNNRGKGTARNIRMEVTEGDDLFADRDLTRNFPFPALVTHQALNLQARVHMQSPRRATVKLIWDDEAGGGSKEITANVF